MEAWFWHPLPAAVWLTTIPVLQPAGLKSNGQEEVHFLNSCRFRGWYEWCWRFFCDFWGCYSAKLTNLCESCEYRFRIQVASLPSLRPTMQTWFMSTNSNVVPFWTIGLTFRMLTRCSSVMVVMRRWCCVWYYLIGYYFVRLHVGLWGSDEHGFWASHSQHLHGFNLALGRHPSIAPTTTRHWVLTVGTRRHIDAHRTGGVITWLGQLALVSLSLIWLCLWKQIHKHSFRILFFQNWSQFGLLLAKTPVRASAIDKICRHHFLKPSAYPLTLKVWVPPLGWFYHHCLHFEHVWTIAFILCLKGAIKIW